MRYLCCDDPNGCFMDTPPDPRTFQLVYTGECYPGHDPQAVRDAVVAALKLDDKRAARLFSGRRVVLRSGVDLPAAHRYIVRFSELGAVVHAEPPLPARSRTSVGDRPSTVRSAPRRRRHKLAASGVVAALALLLVPVVSRLWLGTAPAVPALDPSTFVASASPSAVAPASSSGTAAVAAQGPGDADLPEDMTSEARRDYRERYLTASGHKAFAISASRHHGWHSGAVSPAEAREVALQRCFAFLRPGDEACRVIDADGQLEE